MKRLAVLVPLVLLPLLLAFVLRWVGRQRSQAAPDRLDPSHAATVAGAARRAVIARVHPQPRAASEHWAFQAIRSPKAPTTGDRDWPRNPVDSFVLAKLEEAGFSPAAEADRRTLIRRLSLDLRGLPP